MKRILSLLIVVIFSMFLLSCDNENDISKSYNNDVYYSLFVRSFADSDGDGVGDLNGVTENLDYIEELGITGIWLLPIFESNSYHGYDTTDYYSINPEYGTMDDLDNLIKEANKRGINILLDFVINHTSDQHPWYLDSKSSKESEYRDYYVWNNGSAYESFPGGMKDLNLDNEDVVEEINNIAKFYLDKGVKGFRVDAVGHLFEESGANLAIPKNMLFMNQFKNYVESIREDAFIVGEVFVNDYNILNKYIESGVSYFNFYLRNEIESKIAKGSNRLLLSSNIERSYEAYYQANSDYIDSPFIGNHDIDRVASIYDKDKLRQAYDILLTLPGNPFIYYGDELGMKGRRYEGDNINGKIVYDEYRRQPFMWGDNRETTWLESDGSNDDVETYLNQKENPNSLFNHVKNLIQLRKDNPALFEGKEIYKYDKIPRTQAYVRVINENGFKQALLVVHNVYNDVVETDLDLKVVYGDEKIKSNDMTIFEIPFGKLEGFV